MVDEYIGFIELALLVYPSENLNTQPSYKLVCNDGHAFIDNSSNHTVSSSFILILLYMIIIN